MSWQAVHCFMQAPEMSTVRGSLAAAVLDDKVYAIGGGRPGISLETTEIYDPTLDTFMAGGCPCAMQFAAQFARVRFCVVESGSAARRHDLVLCPACRQAHGAQAVHNSCGASGRCHLRGRRL